MDELDSLEARTHRLHALSKTDPVAWAICLGYRGKGTIAKFLKMPQAEVANELNRLRKAGEVKAVKYGRGWNHRPLSTEMRRLARRAWKLRQEGQGHELGWDDEE